MTKQNSEYCGCLYFSANALSRMMTKMADEAFADTGLSASYAMLLMTINKKPGVQPTEMGQQMHLTPSTITRLIEKLEQKQLVERKSNGRTTEVYPTDKGIELEPKIKEAWLNLFNRYAGLLGNEEAQKLTSDIYNAAKQLE